MATVDDYIAQVRARSEGAGPIGRFFAALYDEELAETEMKPTTTIKHNNQTGRWVTMLVSFAPHLSLPSDTHLTDSNPISTQPPVQN